MEDSSWLQYDWVEVMMPYNLQEQSVYSQIPGWMGLNVLTMRFS